MINVHDLGVLSGQFSVFPDPIIIYVLPES